MEFFTRDEYLSSPQQATTEAALAFAYTAIECSYRTMQRAVKGLSLNEIENAPRSDVVAAIVAAWDVIEYADAIRQLLRVRFPQLPINSELVGLLNKTKSLRNLKVHIAQNARNLSKRPKSVPLHGILRWTDYDPVKSAENYFEIPHISAEPIPYTSKSDELGTQTLKAAGFSTSSQYGFDRVPPGQHNFNLLAFGKEIDLTKLGQQLEALSLIIFKQKTEALENAKIEAVNLGSCLLKKSDFSPSVAKPLRFVVRATRSKQ